MIRVSCYQALNENLSKAFTMLAEKCFLSDLRVLVIVPDQELKMFLDKALWTYSRKYFIPHATDSDPFPEKQPIYLTDKIDNPNAATVAILINIERSRLLNFLSQQSLSQLSRVIFLNGENTALDESQIQNIIKTSPLKKYAYDSFSQNAEGKWQGKG